MSGPDAISNVNRDGAGCPACSACSGHTPEVKASKGEKRRILPALRWVAGGVFFAVALLVPMSEWLRLLFHVAAYLVFGVTILWNAVRGLLRGDFLDENALMSIATIAAFAIGEYPEAIAVTVFYQIGEHLQHRAAHKSRSSINALLALRPDDVGLVTDAGVRRIPPEEVEPGQSLRILAGERVALDAVVVSGTSSVDTSALTGEPVPKDVRPGDEIPGGSVNGAGVLTIKAIRPYENSAAARILHMVEESSSRKAHTERFITRFARVYTPVMVAAAFLMAVVPPLWLGDPFRIWIYRACMLLVISCPCALMLSVPLGYFAGLGAAARRGILVKGGQYLEALEHVHTVVFDKTGTLTHGKLVVESVEAAPDGPLDPKVFIRWMVRMERHSGHPAAQAIAYFGDKNNVEGETPSDPALEVVETAGLGLHGWTADLDILCGSRQYLLTEGVESLPGDDTDTESRFTEVWMAVDHRYAGRVRLSDEIREDAALALADLRKLGVKSLVMMTGDHAGAANHVGQATGIDRIHARLMPGDKVDRIGQIMRERENGEKGRILFAGDGINDAPVLALADAGIAMGASGSDAAVESADIVILSDYLGHIGDVMRIARRTGRIVRENVVLSFGIKLLVVGLAAVGLGGIWQAVFADVGVALLAVLNSLRIMKS